LFGDDSWKALLTTEFLVAHASDRTGYRLEGNPIPHELGLLPSETGCAGAIQIPLDGNPIVLMADAPTVGGYPKIAVVAEADLPVIAQKAPGDRVRFDLITIEESQRALKRRAADLAVLATRRLSGAASA
jgi:allophanate hydrolase subunit 2